MDKDPSTRVSRFPVTEVLARMLLRPYGAAVPSGKLDPLTHRVYFDSDRAASPQQVIELIDLAQNQIDLTGTVEDEWNRLVLDRLVAIVQDMPEDYTDQQRLDVWRYLLQADWFLHHANPNSWNSAFRQMIQQRPRIKSAALQLLEEVYQGKLEAGRELTKQHSDIELMVRGEDFAQTLDKASYEHTNYPEHSPLFSALFHLSQALDSLQE